MKKSAMKAGKRYVVLMRMASHVVCIFGHEAAIQDSYSKKEKINKQYRTNKEWLKSKSV